MKHALFDAFVGAHFDPLFSSAAAFANAEDSAALNVPALHAAARSGIRKVAANAARGLADATTRVLLIDGDAGFGKTHVLTSTLYKLAKDGDVLPVAFQLSADIGENEVARRLLRFTVRELEARHFPNANGWAPIRHLATGLMDLADYDREAFDEAVANYDEETAVAEAVAASKAIGRVIGRQGRSPPEEHLIAAVLLTAERIGADARRWLLGFDARRLGPLVFPPYETESDYFDVLIGLSACAAAIDAPLVLAFDQVEAALTAGSEVLVTRIVTQACQLAELSPSTGIVFSALAGTFPASVLPRLHASIRDRIRHPPSQPIHLKAPDIGILRTVVDRRCEELVRRAQLDPQPAAGRVMVPTWLIEQHTGQTIRELFKEIREYRELCRGLGRFAEAAEFSDQRVPLSLQATEDFDKQWENAKDQHGGSVDQLPVDQRVSLFAELMTKVADELAGVEGTRVKQSDVGKFGTRYVEVTFETDDGAETWRFGFTDEPNSQGQFRDQLNEFLDATTEARPAIIRRRPIPGVKEGRPRRESELANLQAGPAISRLFRASGRAAYTPDQDWSRLRMALEFSRARQSSPGFAEWRRARRFLIETAAVGEIAQLIESASSPGAVATSEGSMATAPSDARDSAELFVGYAPDRRRLIWNLGRATKPVLPNFGLLISGDAGDQKARLAKALIAEVAGLGCPVLVFDFERRYAQDESSSAFAGELGLRVIDVGAGLPFNPLALPPRGPRGSQPIEHVLEVSSILQTACALTDQQTAMLRSSLEMAYRNARIPLREWVDPYATPAPQFEDVVRVATEEYDRSARALVERLRPVRDVLEGPATGDMAGAAGGSGWDALLDKSVILSFAGLSAEASHALAELALIHAQAHMLRGPAPRSLRRLVVFDEATRAPDSDRLIAIARKGRAYGVGLIVSARSPDDLAAELSGNLATRIHMSHSEVRQRRKVVRSVYGTTSSRAARELLSTLGGLGPLDGIIRNPQYAPFERISIEPYSRRKT